MPPDPASPVRVDLRAVPTELEPIFRAWAAAAGPAAPRASPPELQTSVVSLRPRQRSPRAVVALMVFTGLAGLSAGALGGRVLIGGAPWAPAPAASGVERALSPAQPAGPVEPLAAPRYVPPEAVAPAPDPAPRSPAPLAGAAPESHAAAGWPLRSRAMRLVRVGARRRLAAAAREPVKAARRPRAAAAHRLDWTLYERLTRVSSEAGARPDRGPDGLF